MIDPPLTSAGPLQLIEQLAALVRCRVEDEQAIADAHDLRVLRVAGEREHRRGEIIRKFDARCAAAEQPQTMQAEVLKQHDAERASIAKRLNHASRKMRRRYRQRLKAAKRRRDRILAGEAKLFAARERAVEERIGIDGEMTALRRMAMADLAVAADSLLAERGLAPPEKYESPDEETFDRDDQELFAAAMQRGTAALATMRTLGSVRLSGPYGLLLGCAGFAIVGASVAAAAWGLHAWLWIGAAAVVGGILGSLIVNRAAAPLARRQSLAHYGLVRGALATAQAAAASAFVEAKGDVLEQLETLAERRDRKTRKADSARSNEAATMKATLQRKLAANAEKVSARLARMDHERDSAIAAATGGLPQRLAELEQQRQTALASLEDDHAQRIAACLAQRDEELAEVDEDWQTALRRWETALAALDAWSQRTSVPWPQFDALGVAPRACDGVRYGEYLASVPDFVALAEGDAPPAWAIGKSYALPAILSFYEWPALVFVASALQRKQAIDAIFNTMLRIIASLGPDGVRCTIVDPAGRAARFERLAESYATSADGQVQIATSAWQIERALDEHREHIERVRQASGDVTEPQRVLVVLSITPGAAAESCAKLQQIIAHGACGGVTTLAAIDAETLAELSSDARQLSAHALVLRADDGEFFLESPALVRLRTALDEPPAADVAMRMLRGTAARLTNANAG